MAKAKKENTATWLLSGRVWTVDRPDMPYAG